MSRIDPSFTPPVCPPPAEEHEHHVQPGDTLWAVAQKLRDQGDPRGHWEIIKDVQQRNGIKDPNLIYPGQVLKLPPAPSKKNQVVPKEISQFGAPPPVVQFPAAPRTVKVPGPASPEQPQPSGGFIHRELTKIAAEKLNEIGNGGSAEIGMLVHGGPEFPLAGRVKAQVSIGDDGGVNVSLGGGLGAQLGGKVSPDAKAYVRAMSDAALVYKFPSKAAAAEFLASLAEQGATAAVLNLGKVGAVEGSISVEAGLGAGVSGLLSVGGSSVGKAGYKVDFAKGTLTLEGEASAKVCASLGAKFLEKAKLSTPLGESGVKVIARTTIQLSAEDLEMFKDLKVTDEELRQLIARHEKTTKQELDVRVTSAIDSVEREARVVIPVHHFPTSPAALIDAVESPDRHWSVKAYRFDSFSGGVEVPGVIGGEFNIRSKHQISLQEAVQPAQLAAEWARTAPPALPPRYLHRRLP